VRAISVKTSRFAGSARNVPGTVPIVIVSAFRARPGEIRAAIKPVTLPMSWPGRRPQSGLHPARQRLSAVNAANACDVAGTLRVQTAKDRRSEGKLPPDLRRGEPAAREIAGFVGLPPRARDDSRVSARSD